MTSLKSSLAFRTVSVFLAVCLALCWPGAPAFAESVPQVETPNYRVAFYYSANFNMQDDTGTRSGYGYEAMQEISKHMQCTFSYVGYDKTPDESIDALRSGELDLYTAAKKTPEREAEFAFSSHPSITAVTSMNVKVGNTKVVSGDYSTYNGLRIGLLARHTYNNAFIEFTKQKGFDCEIVYYDTPAELSDALVNDEVDALVNSYIRTPEDERAVEEFGETPYYFMARQENQALIDEIDRAIDAMNVETPNWRTDLYNKYYGLADKNAELTESEQALLDRMRENGTVVRGVMSPDGNPYSWYESGEAKGIAADLFRACAKELGLDCEVVPVETREEYREAVQSGAVDVMMDVKGSYEGEGADYRLTDPYITTSVSLLRESYSSGPVEKLAVVDMSSTVREIAAKNWPNAEIVAMGDTQSCVRAVEGGEVDAALLMTYTAQNLRSTDLQNSLQVDIVPGATLDLKMGVNAQDDRDFFGIWEKTLYRVAQQESASTVQSYIEEASTPSLAKYLVGHPIVLLIAAVLVLLLVFAGVIIYLSMRAKRRQQQISGQLACALAEAKSANDAKQNFFSKMSHDIRTPLNVVLGMTQIARTCEDDRVKLDGALESIESEGNYLLVLINSILDVNQLEHGHIELKQEAFCPVAEIRRSVGMLLPLAEKKGQKLTLVCDGDDCVVVGDAGRFGQIALNIVSNAIKYTGQNGTIEVRLQCSPEGVCRFTCTDNGIGMSADFVEHVTDDYTRAEDSRVSKTQGTGLGMSVVKGFTDLMGGTLSVESELGRGSRFIVEVPFAPATSEQRREVLDRAEEKRDYAAEFKGMKVLLAEDNELNAEIATELLKSIGFTVDWAENGKIACERFESSGAGEYTAIFMDMQMPVMDGVEAARHIRASEREDSTIPIFAMTANTFASDRRQCMDAGMTGFISKPVDIEGVAVMLHKSLRSS